MKVRSLMAIAAVIAMGVLASACLIPGIVPGGETNDGPTNSVVKEIKMYGGIEVDDREKGVYLGHSDNTLYFDQGQVKTTVKACPAVSGDAGIITQTMTVSESSIEEITESVENGTSYAVRHGQGLTGLGLDVEVCVGNVGVGVGVEFEWDRGDSTTTDYYSYLKSKTSGVSSTDEYSTEVRFENAQPGYFYRIGMVVEFSVIEAIEVTDVANKEYKASFIAVVNGEYIEKQVSNSPTFSVEGNGEDCAMTQEEIYAAIDTHMGALTPNLRLYTITFDDGQSVTTLVGKEGEPYEIPAVESDPYQKIFVGWQAADGTAPTGIYDGDHDYVAKFVPGQYSDYKLVSTAQDFRDMANDMSGRYCLVADIDLGSWSGLGAWDGGYSAFRGVLDGRGHTVTYTFDGTPYASYDKGRYYGLLTCLEGTVKDLKVDVAAKINKGYSDGCWNTLTSAGGIAGLLNGGTIEGCTVSGYLTFDEDKHWHMESAVGGIAGRSQGGTIKGCEVNANVTADGSTAYAGGIVGYVNGSTLNVSKVLITGEVTAWGSCKGGFLWVKDAHSGCDTFCGGRHDANAGGVVGTCEGKDTRVYIDNAFVASKVTAGAANYMDAGAIVGRCYSGRTYTDTCIYAKGMLFENSNQQNDRVIDGGNNTDQASMSTTPNTVRENGKFAVS